MFAGGGGIFEYSLQKCEAGGSSFVSVWRVVGDYEMVWMEGV